MNQRISKEMPIVDIIQGFPTKGQKLRRAIVNFTELEWELPTERLLDRLLRYKKSKDEIEVFLTKLNSILKIETDINTVSLTEKAALKLKELLSQDGKQKRYLKFADKPAHCGTGLEYILDFSPIESHIDDSIFFSHGIEIRTPVASMKRLIGSLIDFDEGYIDDHLEGLLQIGFLVINPNVKKTCVCGCSFVAE